MALKFASNLLQLVYAYILQEFCWNSGGQIMKSRGQLQEITDHPCHGTKFKIHDIRN
jgi:hypothetical protein